MKLILALFLWLTRKITIIIFLVVTLTCVYFIWNILSPLLPGIINWGENYEQLTSRLSEIQDKISRTEGLIDQLEQDIEDHKATRRPPWFKFWERTKYDAETDLIRLGEKLRQLQADNLSIQNKLLGLTESKEGWIHKYLTMFVNAFKENVYRISYVILLVLVGPIIWKFFWYGVTYLAEKAPPIQMSHPEDSGTMSPGQTGKTIAVTVNSHAPLFVRMNYMSQYDQNLLKHTQLLWKWKAPFVSYTAGLFELTKFSANTEHDRGTVVLSSTAEGQHVAEICLEKHPGIVVHPRHVVGISGNINVKTRWQLTRLHSWLTGQLRYIIFYGTGCLYIAGKGGVQAMPAHASFTRVEAPLLIGFDTRLSYSTARTETFWPYLRGRTLLVDNQFAGNGHFLRQVFKREKTDQTALERNFQFLMNLINAVGKFFGF